MEKMETKKEKKTLIVYTSKHGCTEKVMQKLAQLLDGTIQIADLKRDSVPNPDGFDSVIVGGSIHAGRLQRVVKKFCEGNRDILLKKRLGLVLCCMEEDDKATKQFENEFDKELRDHALAHGLFGGAFYFEKMSFIERAIIKKISGLSQTVEKIDETAIENFARSMNGVV
jgi:menaquinone-dependent protoporphyrinogen oxidase